MAITSGFFDSVSGDRTYNAEQMSNYFDGIVSDGVFEAVGDRMFVAPANDGMKLNVGSGRAIIKCHWIKNDAAAELTLNPADVQTNRIDVVVLRLDRTQRSISLMVKSGTATIGAPSLPAAIRNETIWELYLAAVYVGKGATQITAGNITDLRPSAYCGWVTGVVKQVNTADLFNQYYIAYSQQYELFSTFMTEKMQEFETWFNTLTEQLTVEAGMVKYQRTETMRKTSGDTYVGTKIGVGIAEYDPEEDVLLVFFNGLFFTEGIDYTPYIDPQMGPAIEIETNLVLPSGKLDHLTFFVLKNIIGKDVLKEISFVATPTLQGTTTGIIGVAEMED